MYKCEKHNKLLNEYKYLLNFNLEVEIMDFIHEFYMDTLDTNIQRKIGYFRNNFSYFWFGLDIDKKKQLIIGNPY